MEAHHRAGQGYVAHLHDPLALALALDGSLGKTRAGTVDVELDGTLTRGMTVVDWHGLWGRGPNADVAVEIDVGRFVDELVGRIATLARRRPARPRLRVRRPVRPRDRRSALPWRRGVRDLPLR